MPDHQSTSEEKVPLFVPDPTPEEIAEKLAARITKGKKILEACEGRILENLLIDGKNLKEWSNELMVRMPEDPDDIEGLERTTGKIANAIQKAEFILAVFELQASMAENIFEQEFASVYVAEMKLQEGQKRVAAEKIKQAVLVDKTVDSSLAAGQAAKVIVNYFKRIVKGLEETRKGLENRTKLMALRMRIQSLG